MCLAEVEARLAGGFRVLGSLLGDVRGEPAGAGLAHGVLASWCVTGLGDEAHLLVLGCMWTGLVMGIDREGDGCAGASHACRLVVLCMAQVVWEGNHAGLCACLLG